MAEQLRIIFIWIGVWIAPVLMLAVVFYLILSRPLKQNEQARLFLKLLEQASKSKRPLEAWVVEVAGSEDKSMGIGFHLVAAHIEEGEKFDTALQKVSWFLPPAVRGILLAGLETGNLQQAIAGGQLLLASGISKAQSAFHYLLVLMLFMLPPFALTPLLLKIFVYPRLMAIQADYDEAVAVEFVSWIHLFPYIFVFQVMAVLIAVFFISIYLGIHQRFAWMDRLLGPFADRMNMLIPWKRKRSIAAFSSILSLLLDAEVPETRALELAGQYSGNRVVKSAAERMAERIRQGSTLPQALEEITTRSDFRWRLATAMQTRQGFSASLLPWHQALEAEAFRSEQGTAHIVSSLMIIGIGAVVCVVVASVFLLLNHILSQTLTW